VNNVLKTYNYKTHEYTPMEGTQDWVEVGQLGDGGGSYDWTEFRAFYSPSARRYFWHGDSGCSCNGWGDDLSTAADFEDGDRASLLRAWEEFAKDHSYDINARDYTDGVSEIRQFKEPKS
jgi:hypothetical protein